MMIDFSDRETATAVLVGLLGVLLAVYVYGFYLGSSKPKRPSNLQRSWSFTSVGMAVGVFPESVQSPATVINAALYFKDEAPSEEELLKGVVEPMLAFERLNSIPEPAFASSRPCPNMDATKLIRVVHVPPGKTTDTVILEHLQDSLTDNAARGGAELPWWEWLVVRNRNHSASDAAVLRVHHALADGMSLVSVFEDIVTPALSKKNNAKKNANTTDNGSSSLIAQTLQQKAQAHQKMKFSKWSYITSLFRVIGLAASNYDAPTLFCRPNRRRVHSQKRRAVVFPTLPLAYVKQIKNQANSYNNAKNEKNNIGHAVTLNDVLLTVVSQAIFDYCRARDCPVLAHALQGNDDTQQLQSRALLPVALPRSQQHLKDKTTALVNAWSLVSTDLAVGHANILDRLAAISRSTHALKTSPLAGVQLAVQNHVASKLPLNLGQQTMLDVFLRHSLVFSNVPGPPAACCLAGSKQVVTQVQMFFGNLIPQVGLLSYNQEIFGNLVLDDDDDDDDSGVFPQAERLADFYGRAVVQLAQAVGVDEVVPESLQKFAK